MPELKVDWYQILRYHKTKFVIYGFGQPTSHIMDWSGCNFHHGRLIGYGYEKTESGEHKTVNVNSPTFNTKEEALEWLLDFTKKEISGIRISGHFSGDDGCQKCKHRKLEKFERFFHKIDPDYICTTTLEKIITS